MILKLLKFPFWKTGSNKFRISLFIGLVSFLFVSSLLCVRETTWIIPPYDLPYNTDNSKYIDKFDVVFPKGNGVPKVLFWTGFFGKSEEWGNFYKRRPDEFCPWKCEFSFDQDNVQQSDLIVMNLRDLSDFNDTLPTYRKRSQIWMLHNSEPPGLSWLNLKNYGHVFNWTSFVRTDSDVPCYYGKLEKIKQINSSHSKAFHGFNTLMQTTKSANNEHNKPPNKLVSWVASNCITESQREWYIRELRNYIDIDTYGTCGKLECSRKSPRECMNLMTQYRFYLAFENALCRDYVSEKLWRSLVLGVIPVVMGGAGAHLKVAPKGSFIDFRDFPSPRHLAAYLKKVASNKTLYDSYFDWTKEWKVGGNYFCDVCKSIHEWNGTSQVYRDLNGWFEQDTCSTYSMWRYYTLKLNFIPYYVLYYLGLCSITNGFNEWYRRLLHMHTVKQKCCFRSSLRYWWEKIK